MKIEPQSYGNDNLFIPKPLSESQKLLCKRLDELFKKHSFEVMPSKMLQGAIFSSDKRLRNNPDWLSQSANSLREILYPFYSREVKKAHRTDITNHSAVKNRDFETEIGTFYSKLNGLAHHGNADKNKMSKKDIENINFDELILSFEKLMREVLKRQIDLHKEIDSLLSTDLKKVEKDLAQKLIEANLNTKQYFFFNAPTDWVFWLNKNGFFQSLNVKYEDQSNYGTRLPELHYLLRVVEGGDQEEVVKIINSTDCVKNFNPEVINQFIWITQKLSLENLEKVAQKIEKENWVSLMCEFKDSAYSYAPQIKGLSETKKFESLLSLARVVLTLNQKEKKEGEYFYEYFCLSDLGSSGVFEALTKIEDNYIKEAIELILNIFKSLTYKNKGDATFPFSSTFYLYEVNLFNASVHPRRHGTSQEDLESLMGVLANLIKKQSQQKELDTKGFYEEVISKLPESKWMWRIKLFFMSFYSDLFDSEIKTELHRFFGTKDFNSYVDFISDTEYYHILSLVFANWNEKEKRNYVNKILKYFSNPNIDADDQYRAKGYGFRILSSIYSDLTEKEKELCERNFGKKPEAGFNTDSIKIKSRSGSINYQSPIDINEYKDIKVLIKDLKNDLSPSKLKEKYKDDDFLKPRNAEGLGDAIKQDVKLRINEYLIHASDFLDNDIDTHYTYSLMRGIEEYLRDKSKLNKDNWDNLFTLFNKIQESKQRDSDKKSGRWLASWSWIEKSVADLLLFFLTKEYSEFFKEKRSNAFELITHLLSREDKSYDEDKEDYSNLFTVAINTTKGRAFQGLVSFIYQDGDDLKEDVLELYKDLVNTQYLPLRFEIGYYLSSFYFRNTSEVSKLFEKIFPKNDNELINFFAAWDGYLSNSIYKELFEDLEDYYNHALNLDFSSYSKDRNDENINNRMGIHLALAFAHFNDVQYKDNDKHKLLEQLWSSHKIETQKEFISFLGRGIISHSNASDEWFKEKNVVLDKLKSFWELILDQDLNEEIYASFGFWINHKRKIFEYDWLVDKVKKTLIKSKGNINWDLGLMDQLMEFAKTDAKKTITIIEKYLVDGILGESNNKNWFYLDEDKTAIFDYLHTQEPKETEDLINKLLEKGGRTFWPLMDIFKD